MALDELCDRKINNAIQKRGYCYYGGTKIYPTDWIKARDAFIKYYSMTGDPNSANTLENIFIASDRFYLDETDEKRSFIFTSIYYEDFGDFEEPIEFYFYNKRVTSISFRNIYFTSPKKKKNNTIKYHFVRVVFDNAYRTYDYLCDDFSVKVEDTVVVNTDRGEIRVRVVEVFDMPESELLLPYEMYKKI